MNNASDPFNRLSEEADQLAEPFSPSLHAKVMRRVREEAAEPATRLKERPYTPWYLGGACAAMVLIAVTINLWLHSTPPTSPMPIPPTASPDDSSFVEWLDHATEPVRQSIHNSTTSLVMGGLDHDAKAFSYFMLEQVSQLPRKPV